MRSLLAVVAAFLFAIPIHASEYVYRDGYWWYDGIPYTRTAYTEYQSYYSCGRYYSQPVTSYSYTRYYPPTASVSYKDADWRAKLLDIAAQRDKFEGQMRKAAVEQANFVEAVNALGLSGNFAWQNYGTFPGYPVRTAHVPAQLQLGAYGANGNTLYGYSYSSAADVYGSTDLNLLYQQSAALAKNSQDLGGKATDNFAGLVQAEGSNRARVAEILAKGQSASATLKAADAAVSASVRVQASTTGSRTVPPVPVAPGVVVPTPTVLTGEAIFRNRCASCHAVDKVGATEAGMERIVLVEQDGSIPLFSAVQKREIERQVLQGLMPKGTGPLPKAEQDVLVAFLRAQKP